MEHLWPEEGDSPEIVHRVVYVIIKKCSFEAFMCLDLVYDHLQLATLLQMLTFAA